jgi:dethiobiotin synthetase
MTSGLFVTGTDTGVGKTRVAAALVAWGAREGLRMAAMKPVATGCHRTEAGLRNEDAQHLMAGTSAPAEYELVNPYAFEPPVAPHLAAAAAGAAIDKARIVASFQRLAGPADRVIVEGVGGWKVPISLSETMEDVAIALGLPVVLVVGVRLGCLNHTLLTAEAIERSGLRMAGWVANHIDVDCALAGRNVETLCAMLGCPPLAVVPWSLDDAATTAQRFDRARLQRLLA